MSKYRTEECDCAVQVPVIVKRHSNYLIVHITMKQMSIIRLVRTM